MYLGESEHTQRGMMTVIVTRYLEEFSVGTCRGKVYKHVLR